MCEKRFSNGQRDNVVGNGTTCHHRSVVDRQRCWSPSAKACTRRSVHKHLQQQRPHGIRKDLHWYKGKKVNFEALDLADLKIIENCQFNKLYFIQ